MRAGSDATFGYAANGFPGEQARAGIEVKQPVVTLRVKESEEAIADFSQLFSQDPSRSLQPSILLPVSGPIRQGFKIGLYQSRQLGFAPPSHLGLNARFVALIRRLIE